MASGPSGCGGSGRRASFVAGGEEAATELLLSRCAVRRSAWGAMRKPRSSGKFACRRAKIAGYILFSGSSAVFGPRRLEMTIPATGGIRLRISTTEGGRCQGIYRLIAVRSKERCRSTSPPSPAFMCAVRGSFPVKSLATITDRHRKNNRSILMRFGLTIDENYCRSS